MSDTINIVVPGYSGDKQAEETPQRKEVWPTLLTPDEPRFLKTELYFFDLATVRDPDTNEFVDIPGWYNDYDGTSGDHVMDVRKTISFECRDLMPFHFIPKDTEIRIYTSSNSCVDPDVISEQFGSDNEDRWDRKPLLTMAVDWERDGHRWILGGTYQTQDGGGYSTHHDKSPFVIRATLRKSKDANDYAVIDPSRFHQHKATKLKEKWEYHLNETRPLIYWSYISGKYGLKIDELSKSFGHYLSGAGLTYAYDWIDGVFFCPFDTLDTGDGGKYKITRSPSYDADAVTGKFIGPGKYEIFLAPRRVAYVTYYHHHEFSGSRHETTIGDSFDEDDPCDNHLAQWWENGENEDNDLSDVTRNLNVFDAEIVDSTYYIGILYGRWPSDWAPHNISIEEPPTDETPIGSEATLYFYNDSNAYQGSKDIIWEESAEDAQQHFVDAGGSEEDSLEIYSGGGSSLHVIADTTPYYIRVGSSGLLGLTPLDACKNTMFMGPIFELASQEYDGWQFQQDDSSFGIKRLWSQIVSADYWTDLIGPLRSSAVASSGDNMQSSRIDSMPYGVGLCPGKEGDLVGIIRKGGSAWFIWLAGDEDFSEEDRYHSVGTPYFFSFQTRSSDGSLEHYSEGKWNDEQTAYDGDFTDQFTGTGRKLTKVGRSVSFNEGDEHST